MDPSLDKSHAALGQIQLKSRFQPGLVFWIFPLTFLGIFFFFPLSRILARSDLFSGGVPISMEQWLVVEKPLVFTIYQSCLSTLITLIIGIPGAYVISHYQFPGRNIFRALLVVPFILPTVVVASSLNALLGPSGLINQLSMSIFSLDGHPIRTMSGFWMIILAHVFYNTSLVILVVGEAWAKLNPNYGFAARALGATPFSRILRVILPLLAPAILSASILVFLFDFTSFGVILLLGGPLYATLEVEIYIQAIQMLDFRMAAILSSIQIIATIILAFLHSKINRGYVFEITPHFAPQHALSKVNASAKLFAIGTIFLLFLLFITPIIALVIRSIDLVQADGLSLVYYAALFKNSSGSYFYIPPYKAILNSFTFAAITLVLTLPLGFLSALALRSPIRVNRILEPLLLLPLGSSAVTLGLGLLLTFNSSVFTNIRFPLLLPIAHSLIALPLVIRILQPALNAIPANLSQSARLLGANRWRTFWNVEFPLLRQPLIVSSVFTFSISLGEFGATSFLTRPEYPTIPIAIYRFLSQPGQMNYGQALAMSSLLMLTCVACILLIQIELPLHKEVG